MSCIPSLLVIIFTLISVVEGYRRRTYGTRRNTRYTYVGGGYVVGYVFGGIIGLIILLLIIYFCIKHANAKKQRVRQQPVVVYTGASSGQRPFQGTVPQPPPYIGPPPVYSAGLFPPQRKGTGDPPPYPNPQSIHRNQDPFYTAGSAFPPPLQQYPPPPQPKQLSSQNGLSPLSVNPPGQNEGVPVAPQTSTQANATARGQDSQLPPLQPLRPTASAPPTEHDV